MVLWLADPFMVELRKTRTLINRDQYQQRVTRPALWSQQKSRVAAGHQRRLTVTWRSRRGTFNPRWKQTCWEAAAGSPVQVQPVAGDVQAHAELEQEGVGGVEQGQVDQQAHGGAAVRQHVHHGAELSGWRKSLTKTRWMCFSFS